LEVVPTAGMAGAGAAGALGPKPIEIRLSTLDRTGRVAPLTEEVKAKARSVAVVNIVSVMRRE